jgi:hypothetical protein
MVGVSLVAFVAAACNDPLTAKNYNNPDVERVFQQPASIEQTMGTGYQQCRNAEKGGNTPNPVDMTAQLATMSFESYSQLGNFNMGLRGAIPRSPILNNKSATQSLNGAFGSWSRQARLQGNAMKQLDALREANGIALPTAAADLRARALGFLNMGCNLGWLSLTFDSAGIIDHFMGRFVPELSGYMSECGRYCLSGLGDRHGQHRWFGRRRRVPDDRRMVCRHSAVKDRFIQLTRSLKARFRAQVARTPAERAAVNWALVAADADAGLTADLVANLSPTAGWNLGVQASTFYQDAGWSQITPMIFGFADVSGGYDTWRRDTPEPAERRVLIITPDLRFRRLTRAAPAASADISTYTNPYLKNRVVPVHQAIRGARRSTSTTA